MKTHLVFSVVLCGITLIACGKESDRLVLIDAQKAPVILIAPSATKVEEYAARELQTYLGRITGKNLEITMATCDLKGPCIILGSHPGNDDLNWKSLTPDEYVIEVGPNGLRIAGGRAPLATDNKGNVYVRERGTLYGVYEVLEQLGVRWYRPEPWGEHVPRLETVAFPKGRTTYRPGYKYRSGLTSYRHHSAETPEQRKWGILWGTRNRQNVCPWPNPELGGHYILEHHHSYHYIMPHDRYFPTHPEYYALIDGKRSADPEAQLCLSNPEVERIVTEDLIAQARANPQLQSVSIDPNDGMTLWCQCEACQAMDDPKLMNRYGGVSMVNRVAAFSNRVARKVAAAVPNVKLSWLAYSGRSEVPTRVKQFEPNTLVWATAYQTATSDWSKNLEDPSSPNNAALLKILKGYSALTEIGVYEYFGGYAWFGPMPTLGMITDRLRHYRNYRVVGVYTQGGHWGPNGLSTYLAAKLMWNPDLDVAQELDLYYRNYYGPAATPMKVYYETMEQAVATGPTFYSGGYGIERFFTDELLGKLGPSINQARELVKGKDPYEKRLEGVWAGFEVARRFREFLKLKETDCLGADNALKGIETFVLSYPSGDTFDNSKGAEVITVFLRAFGNDLREQAEFMRHFKNPRMVQDHSKQWRFQTDPKDEGLADGWMKPDLNTKNWPLLDADLWWQQQGYGSYHGAAWYRRQFRLPVSGPGDRIILYFGAVDGDATVFVNGQKVGEHLLGKDGDGWDKPFYFDITDHLKQDAVNLMAVRVLKNSAMSGIFKGVKILRVDKIEDKPS